MLVYTLSRNHALIEEVSFSFYKIVGHKYLKISLLGNKLKFLKKLVLLNIALFYEELAKIFSKRHKKE